MRGIPNFRFFRSAPKPPPKDRPKPAISAPQNLRYEGGKSAQGRVIDLAHNPNPPHTRPAIPAGPHNAPTRPSAQGHDLSHMNLSADSSLASLALPLEKPLPALPPGATGTGSVSSGEASTHRTVPWLDKGKDKEPAFRGSVPWLHGGSAPGSAKPMAASGSMIPPELLAGGGTAGAGSRGSVPEAQARRVDAFWNGLDRHIDSRLGPGDNHDMQDLLRATDNPMFRLILDRHPAVGGMERQGGRALPPEFRNAPRPPEVAERRPSAPPGDRPAAEGNGSVTGDRALWRDLRRQEAARKREGGEGRFLP